MAAIVCKGATCVCTYGMTPCVLNVTGTTKAGGAAVATISDHGVTNLQSFGMCSSLLNPQVASATAAAMGVLTPQPCSPKIVSPWTGGSPTVKVRGVSVITGASVARCVYGGSVRVVRLTQNTVKSS